MEIIKVKQLPEIVERLHTIKEEIEKRVDEALALEVTSNTVKDVKKIRAALTKDFKSLEDKRKDVKRIILEPYERFERVYKDCVTNVYVPADRKLSERISEVESELKSEKEKEIIEYFEELKTANSLDFVSFSDTGIKVNLSSSKNSLIEMVDIFIDGVNNDIKLLETQEHYLEKIIEYKKSLDVSQAIMTVDERVKELKNEKERTAVTEEKKAETQARVEVINEVLMPPKEVDEKQYTATFTVTGTLEELKKLKEFMEKENLHYEQR